MNNAHHHEDIQASLQTKQKSVNALAGRIPCLLKIIKFEHCKNLSRELLLYSAIN